MLKSDGMMTDETDGWSVSGSQPAIRPFDHGLPENRNQPESTAINRNQPLNLRNQLPENRNHPESTGINH